jgi:hypothetical protein
VHQPRPCFLFASTAGGFQSTATFSAGPSLLNAAQGDPKAQPTAARQAQSAPSNACRPGRRPPCSTPLRARARVCCARGGALLLDCVFGRGGRAPPRPDRAAHAPAIAPAVEGSALAFRQRFAPLSTSAQCTQHLGEGLPPGLARGLLAAPLGWAARLHCRPQRRRLQSYEVSVSPHIHYRQVYIIAIARACSRASPAWEPPTSAV